MSKPRFTIYNRDRTPGGNLTTAHLQKIRYFLSKNNGMILLPSDTGYSLAVRPRNAEDYKRINLILDRGELPVSLAFNNFFAVEQFIEITKVVACLLEKFTPGGITVVCKANPKIPREFITDSIHVSDGTIGVRIPDSSIEREVAGCVNYLPVTTVAVRDEQGNIVQDFTTALEIVSKGMKAIGFTNWAAIEGDTFLQYHSTVIRVNHTTHEWNIEREGMISEEQVSAALDEVVSQWALERL